MKLIIIGGAIVAVVLLLTGLFFTGNLPGLSILDNGTVTKTENHNGVKGTPKWEVIGPNNRNAFICSYISTSYSEDIVVQGKMELEATTLYGTDYYYYKIYLKKDAASSYELVSAPGITTSPYISKVNPGNLPSTSIIGYSEIAPRYDFHIMGSGYANGAVKAEFWARTRVWPGIDAKDVRLASDEAYLYSGWGGLYLPKDANGTHFKSTFEIGEHVKIQVKTSYGAISDSNGTVNTWRVTLQKPMSQGGTVFKTQDYGNNVNTWFEFDVTSDMFMIGGDNTWTMQIYNALAPKGTLNVYTIDFAAKAPSIVSFSGFSGDDQYKVGSTVSCKLSATPGTGQLPIAKFKVCIIYGNYDVLMPSDPLDQLWLLPWTDVTDISSSSATLSFTPKHQSWVTVHAVAVDSEGRTSITENTHTIWVYNDIPASDDQLGDDTGDHEYGGGSTNPGWQFDPGTADMKDWLGYILKIIIALAIIIVTILCAVFVPVPLYGKAIIILVGVVIAVLYFMYAPLLL